ncbi:MAG: hypothetical protein NTV79_10670 [Candidatus Aureabacteria bacterium]|nr:hypothetical protein [Candidatus Auribacterota bacterium]
MKRIMLSALFSIFIFSLITTRTFGQDTPPGPSAQPSPRENAGVALGFKIGTLGPGADLTVGIAEKFNLRGNVNYLGFSYRRESGEDNYRLKVDALTGLALLDWHVGGGQFRLSAGACFANGYGEFEHSASDSIKVGDNSYPGPGVGTLTRKVKLPTLAPYVGIGVGNAVGKNEDITFSFDLGVVIPWYDVEVTADGPLNTDPAFLQDLAREKDTFKNDVRDVPVYPVLSFGLAFKF